VTLDLLLEDGDGISVLKVIAGARLAGPNVVISGMDCRAS
jgi:two-component system chemotaxis response regulator CheY